jgi:hypothetical protein
VACQTGYTCQFGACHLTCSPNIIGQNWDICLVNGVETCINVLGDKDHCGDCAKVCPNGQFCNSGLCTSSCVPGPEICDGADNNCNGQTDEGFNKGLSCSAGSGACKRFGVYICNASGGTVCTATAGQPATETCNGVDDNCDGKVDEGLSCDCNPSKEVCDGIDNNCDGNADETFNVGKTCTAGAGACARFGFVVCDGFGQTKCTAVAGQPGTEVCNGVDDNCDGTADEGLSCACSKHLETCNGVDDDCNGKVDDNFGVGNTCLVGVGSCARLGVLLCNGSGGTKCSAEPGAKAIETCNGLDDNCDGTADEGLSCSCSVQPEVCDGRDNNCDGTVDNGFNVGSACTVGTGACLRVGIVLCNAQGTTTCSATTGIATPEVCDGIDNNCNGTADEGLTTCTCLSQPEVCDGVDNDCDKTTDNGFNVGMACLSGTGACRRVGVILCNAQGGTVCSATQGTPALVESCNGIDDDCDGAVDEGLTTCTCLVQAETCDGVDNNCDGTVDNGFNVGSACTVGTGACSRTGILLCNAQGATSCSATAGVPAVESCNGIDDNCDGTIDENLSCACSVKVEICDGVDNNCNGQTDEGLNLGQPCVVGVGACQHTGTRICDGAGGVKCSATAGSVAVEICNGIDDNCNGTADEGLTTCTCLSQPEVCDGIDNNCDGTVDNGYGVGSACTVGTGACMRTGVLLCNAQGTTTCSATTGIATPEVCDGIDNNCNGSADEGLTGCNCLVQTEICDGRDNNCNGQVDETFGVGNTCVVGTGACQRVGTIACTPQGTSVCSAATGNPATEVCNGIDDNCDGNVDENLSCACSIQTEICDGRDNNCNGQVDESFGVGTPCSIGVGACQRIGVLLCNAQGTTSCSATAGLASPEVCDGVDNNCNGIADDGISCSCLPSAEVCDGRDNNCNGQVDEGFGVGNSCSVGVGACQRLGYTMCSGGGTVCSAIAGNPVGETCNGIDDNCNGTADEGLSCACFPVAETCNGRDDNCNGTVDEGYATGSQCSVGTGICLRTGVTVCTANGLTTQCSATSGTPAPAELCGNNLDDNCNGSTDEAGCTPMGGSGNVTITSATCFQVLDIRSGNPVIASSSANTSTCEVPNFSFNVLAGDNLEIWGNQPMTFISALAPVFIEGRCSTNTYSGLSGPGWSGLVTDYNQIGYAILSNSALAPSYSVSLGISCGALGYVYKAHF